MKSVDSTLLRGVALPLLLAIVFAGAFLTDGIMLVDAFSGGAGQCLLGKSSVDGFHLDLFSGRKRVTGKLLRGGFVAILNGINLGAPAKGERKIKVGATHLLKIKSSETAPARGADRMFRGVLVAATPSLADAVFSFSKIGADPSLQETNNCLAPTVGITHTDSVRKKEARMALTPFNETLFTLDTNVVVANNVTWSIYYYQKFSVKVVPSCQNPGQRCATSAECCLGRACVGRKTSNKRCRACKKRGAECSRTDECCNGLTCRLKDGKRKCRS
jgi:hypothetical protein